MERKYRSSTTGDSNSPSIGDLPEYGSDLTGDIPCEEGSNLLPYRDWIDPLLTHHIWATHSPIASEYMVIDPDASLAGCMDAILINEDKDSPLYGSLLLLDLKTKSKPDSRPPNAAKQLGGYINLLRTTSPDHADFADQIKQVAIICNRPLPVLPPSTSTIHHCRSSLSHCQIQLH